ncbi:MAG: prolyl oligopeptidase family serine peptidase [Steroidobacteraceae bacterium]
MGLRTVCFAAALFAAAADAQGPGQPAPAAYPDARRGPQYDSYHGVSVADPYRWMEDIDSPETRTWVQAEAAMSSAYLAAIPGRGRIEERLRRLWNYGRWSAPDKHGSNWFYTHNDGLQNQSLLFTTTDPDAASRVLLDPNGLSQDGTVAFKGAGYSDDGRLMAYALSEAGSDWEIWRVRDVASGQDLPDEIRWAKNTAAHWRKDGSGFYYSGYEPPKSEAPGSDAPGSDALKAVNQYQKLYFHTLGTPQAQDQLIYARRDDGDWFVDGNVTDDGHYLIITASHGDDVRNTLLVQDLTAADAPIRPVIAEPTANYTFVGSLGSTLYLQTDAGAPRYRIVAVDLAAPDPVHLRTVVGESPDTLDSATLVGHQLIVQYLKDAHSAVRRFSPTGKPLGEVRLPGIGTVFGFAGHADDTVTYFGYASFTTPTSIFRMNLQTGAIRPWRAPQLDGFDPRQYRTTQVFFAGKDGTRVPMFVTARAGIKLDGTNPTILYGYGGFNIPEQPFFSPAVAAWLEMGGVYAVATLRGGSEYGRAWHEAGMKTRKQNVFDDFIAAAEYLIARKWTNPRRLAIRGASNGGLLVGAVLEQRPDLFAAAVAQVGVMDMLRFREFTVGKGWESDYGSVDDPQEFRALLAYSPYHNVRSGVDYPATLILTGDHDDRVFPAHSFKFAAAMQNADAHGRPILIRIDLRAGHGAGKPLGKQIDETADIYAFIRKSMGIEN